MDGENTTLYHDHIHARSLDGRHHPSRDWVKAFHGNIKWRIPYGIRICGENVYAEHSVRYDNLESYFLGFGVWDDEGCWSWDESVALFDELGITSVPVIWRGKWETFTTPVCGYSPRELTEASMCHTSQEGYVVRTADGFAFEDFQTHVAKYVRKDHVQTDQHWMAKPVVANGLKS